MRGHTHRCTACDKDAPCGGRYERNFDGFPEAVCSDYHSYRNQPWVCEDCREYACESGQSEDCEPYKATETFTPHKGTPIQGTPFKVCAACIKWETDEEERASERAYERQCEDFYGGSSPQTVQEQYDAAAEEKRRLRR